MTDKETGEFLLRACHDLRTSLRTVQAHAELMGRDAAGGQEISGIGERLGFIIDGARRMDLLVEGLVSYAIALEIDGAEFQMTALDIVLRSVLAKLDKELRTKDATVTYKGLPSVRADPDRLIQVFESLLRNALQFRGAESPKVHIAAEKHREGWLFSVQDNGVGIEKEYTEAAFKAFERLHGKRHPGPGLGLTICREIVERHGGRMWMVSKAGAGTTVYFTLPED